MFVYVFEAISPATNDPADQTPEESGFEYETLQAGYLPHPRPVLRIHRPVDPPGRTV